MGGKAGQMSASSDVAASWSRRRRAAIAALATAVLVGIVMPVTVSGERIADPDYVGKGRFDRNMKVQFSLYEERGRLYVKFEAKNVKFICDDGTEIRRTFTTIRTERVTRRGFEKVLYDDSAGDLIYWFRGKFFDGGKTARGFLLSFYDAAEPPAGSGGPSCTTFGKRSWKAKRVG